MLDQRIRSRPILLFLMKSRFRIYMSQPSNVKFFGHQKLRYLKNFENSFNSDFDVWYMDGKLMTNEISAEYFHGFIINYYQSYELINFLWDTQVRLKNYLVRFWCGIHGWKAYDEWNPHKQVSTLYLQQFSS